ncbi:MULTISPECIES: hypothetical protein [Rhodomicrobium]|uniref:hypothetical protein n=1 Tax=Rhodomicrobium TaxID=1068 RepID=UPI000B4B6A9F|nr:MULTISPECIES: hypothetical protein [Rhodomicrobium]
MSRDDDHSSSKPSHIAYSVREGKEGKSYFNRVGSAFEHGDGKGFNIKLDAMPVNGQVVLRTPQERLEEKRKGEDRRDRRDDRRSSRDRDER